MRTRLNKQRLEAIIEALTSRTAGEMDLAGEDAIPAKDYEKALDWAFEMLQKKQSPNQDGRGLPTP